VKHIERNDQLFVYNEDDVQRHNVLLQVVLKTGFPCMIGLQFRQRNQLVKSLCMQNLSRRALIIFIHQ